jgi:hypothetical protein
VYNLTLSFVKQSNDLALFISMLSILFVVSVLVVPSLQGCISFTGSTACPEFGGFSIDLGASTLRNQYPNLDAVDNFLNGNSVIEDIVPACKDWSDTKQQVRFAKTLRCVALVASSSACNNGKRATLCKESCNLFAVSYEKVGKQVCASNSTGVERQTGEWKKFCDSIPASNNCIAGEKNEDNGCGTFFSSVFASRVVTN